jgi:hypothetical protein
LHRLNTPLINAPQRRVEGDHEAACQAGSAIRDAGDQWTAVLRQRYGPEVR